MKIELLKTTQAEFVDLEQPLLSKVVIYPLVRSQISQNPVTMLHLRHPWTQNSETFESSVVSCCRVDSNKQANKSRTYTNPIKYDDFICDYCLRVVRFKYTLFKL